jgi:hypothetical protein
MTATSARRAPRRHLALASCVAISLLLLALAAPARSVAQIGSQTGYQEWIPPERDGGGADGREEVPGGSGGASAGGGGGGAYASGGGAAYAGAGDPAYGSGPPVAGGHRGGAAHTRAVGAEPSGKRNSRAANQAGQPPVRRVTAGQSEVATGTIPLTRDNILLALAVAAVAIGAGLSVNRLARRTAGT